MSTDPDQPGPVLLKPLGTDEYEPPARTQLQLDASAIAQQSGGTATAQLALAPRRYWASRRGTAAGLLALNEAAGDTFFEVAPQAALDDQAAEEAFASDGPVVDVQSHWVAPRPELRNFQEHVLQGYRRAAPQWWTGLDGISAYNMAEYMRCVFIESETAMAVISSSPASSDGDMMLTNAEMAGMRELFDRMAGTGRLQNHTVVRPNLGEAELMPDWVKQYKPVGWKVYTLGHMSDKYLGYEPGSEWKLDDDKVGIPFLEEVRKSGVNLVCAHKGVSGMVASGSPVDVGPAAKLFPDINFVIYHSGYEPGQPEGPFLDETADAGVNRLIDSLRRSGVGAGDNVYAELGTTWFNLISRPVDAAHVIGKLLVQLGADNIIWGTDAIWYGPTQPALDAFRTFQIPDAICEQFGYPKITLEMRRKILAGNAARVYGVDLDDLAAKVKSEDVLSWTKDVLAETERYGLVRAH